MVHKITKYYFIATLGGSFMYGFCPFLVVFYNLARDSYSLRSWSLHYNNVWWVLHEKYKINASIGWEIYEYSSLGYHLRWIRQLDLPLLMWFSRCPAGLERRFWSRLFPCILELFSIFALFCMTFRFSSMKWIISPKKAIFQHLLTNWDH